MKASRDWRAELACLEPDPKVERIAGRGGESTVRIGKLFLHSRYQPREEAERLADSAELKGERPVLVIGLGLGYHVDALLKRDMTVAVVEPSRTVAKFALDGPMRDADFLLGVGDVETLAASPGFLEFAERVPQILVHPATAQLYPEYVRAVKEAVGHAALGKQRLGIAIVGPLYGGSLPITRYLERAFAKLGHRTLLVDNSAAWELYQRVSEGIRTKIASNQLTAMLTNFLNEWSYARVAEFVPDICIVMAQAPVNVTFPARLAREGVVTAFWYVENWRHLPYWKEIAPYYDYFFHIQPGLFDDMLQEAGCRKHAAVLTACDPEVHRPVQLQGKDREEFVCDLSFAGAAYYNRVRMLSGLTDYDFKIWGVEWHQRELAPHWQRPGERFEADTYCKIASGSKINLNLHSSTTSEGVDARCDAVNPRVFEIAACGGFQVCDPCIGLDRLFDFEAELPVYRNLVELRETIDYFLKHPRERAAYAARARERVLRDHTYENRAQQMLDLILESYSTRILNKGIRVQRTMAEMSARLGSESELGAYLATLPKDLMFTHENINKQLEAVSGEMPHAAQVFCYLRELRHFAEALLGLIE